MRGKKTDPQTIYNIMASYAVTNNSKETAKALNIPQTTIDKIVKDNKDKKEFVKLWAEKKADFADKATEIIDMGLKLLHRRMNTAIEHEDKLDELIQEIYMTPGEEMNEKQKTALINKVKALELQKLSEITTAVGTLYDKRALAKGDSTENSTITVKMNEEMTSWAK